jgi:hypothetical protein
MPSLNLYNTTTTTLFTILGTSFTTAKLGNQLDQSIILVERNPKRYGALNMAISGLDCHIVCAASTKQKNKKLSSSKNSTGALR